MTAQTLPSNFGRYQLLERIGEGGMAEVFRARLGAAAGAEKVVCIKRILPHLSRNSDFTSMFVGEAKIALPLSHGNITQVFDFGEIDGVYFLAMEYVRGQNLAVVLERAREAQQPLDLPAVLWVGTEVSRGLHYAHSFADQQGRHVPVVHRDVSPHNVLISYNGDVKLTDFGIALAPTTTVDGSAGVVRGKPAYVSPEQTRGERGDQRSDVFSMGTLIHEMLTGRRAFEGANDQETLRNVRERTPPEPSSLNKACDAAIDRIVMKALAKDPAARHQTAEQLHRELRQELLSRASDYESGQLAKTMADLFSWELAAAQGETGVRDRLLFQLSRAGVKVDGGKATTDELLKMGTVAIPTVDGVPTKPKTGSRAPIAIALVVLLLIGAGVGVWQLIANQPSGTAKVDAGITKLPKRKVPSPIIPKSLHPANQLREIIDALPDAPAAKAPAKGVVAKARPPRKSGRPSKTRKPRPKAVVEPPKVANKPSYINCNSWPWSIVHLNGKRLPGNTPIYRVPVRPGKHRIKFENPELGLTKEVTVNVAPGVLRTVAVTLRQ